MQKNRTEKVSVAMYEVAPTSTKLTRIVILPKLLIFKQKDDVFTIVTDQNISEIDF